MPFILSHKKLVLIGAVVLAVLIYIGYGALLTFMQERIVYEPGRQDFADCPALASAEQVEHEGTRMYYKEVSARLVVFYHGNAGSACDRAFLAQLFESLGYSYLLPEYAGYSNDPRQTTHELVKADVEHAIAFAHEKKYRNVAVVGQSIGTGPAAYHASLAPTRMLILLSPFTTLPEAASYQYWYYPTSLLVKNPFDNVALLSEYRGKAFVIHGDRDDVIPLELGRKLYDTFKTDVKDRFGLFSKKFVVITGAGHNDLFVNQDTVDAITEFLEQ